MIESLVIGIIGSAILDVGSSSLDKLRRNRCWVRSVTSDLCGWTTVDVPKKEFRRWLKEKGLHAFLAPPEDGAVGLALDLKQAILASPSAIDFDALSVVMATYAAIACRISPSKAALLRDSWQDERFTRLRMQFAEVAHQLGRWETPTGLDLASLLIHQSDVRRESRLASVGLSEEESKQIAEIILPVVPDVGAGEIALLIGPMGSGKSEIAEQWHRNSVTDIEGNANAPMPVFYRSRDLIGTTLEAAVATRVGGSTVAHQRGLSLVIDGLDEVSLPQADSLLSQVRELLAANQRSRALITSRLADIDGTGRIKCCHPEPLTDDQKAIALSILCQNSSMYYRWSRPIQMASSLPFFLLIAGKLSQTSPSLAGMSPASMIDTIVK